MIYSQNANNLFYYLKFIMVLWISGSVGPLSHPKNLADLCVLRPWPSLKSQVFKAVIGSCGDSDRCQGLGVTDWLFRMLIPLKRNNLLL